MSKKIKICSSLVFCLAGILFFSWAFAQQALPAGGSSFETAILLGPGTYQGSLAEDEVIFYRVQANAGQEIKIETNSGDTWLVIYSDGKEELQWSGSDKFVHWLPNSEKSTHTFYLEISNEAFEPIESFTLQISLINRYDANFQTDAGDTFEKALNVTTGEYQGYLAGTYPAMTPKGDDFKDYYRVSVKKGTTYTFRVTPPSADEIGLELFNLNRESIDENSSANPGAIVNLSLSPTANTDIFILVEHGGPISGEVLSYKLNIDTSTPLTRFYVCEEESCELAGEFSSKEECQKATAKDCYQTSSCSGGCIEPLVCAKNSDCPINNTCVNGQCVAGEEPPVIVCQDECSSGQTKCFDNFNYHRCGDYNGDDCLEWSSPVYCGEGNKCQGGECVETTGCQCSAWVEGQCGASDCSEDEMSTTRICTPASCDIEESCISSSSCQIILPPSNNNMFILSFLSNFPVLIWFSGWNIIIWLLTYILISVYLAICLQVLAKKTGTENGWMAWIPIANIFLMINIAKKPLWWFVLILIPIVNIVIGVILCMAIAERRGKENWIGILVIVPVIGIAVPGYLAFFDYKKGEKIEITPPYASTGSQEANKPTVGYKHPCKYCGKLIPPNSVACPFCEKVNPLGPDRCPKCHEPIDKKWKVCTKCNQNLRIVCPYCGKVTFFGNHCEDCGARLLVTCPSCGQEQPPLDDQCIKCGKPMEKK